MLLSNLGYGRQQTKYFKLKILQLHQEHIANRKDALLRTRFLRMEERLYLANQENCSDMKTHSNIQTMYLTLP